jgi:flagellar protein FlaH
MSYTLDIKLERDELHSKMGGGIPANSLTIVEGTDGGGKSVVCQRIAYALKEKGHSITYISSEMNTAEFIMQMSSLGYDVLTEVISEKVFFIPMFPFFGDIQFDDNFMTKLFNHEHIYKNEIIIFDTFSDLIMSDKSKRSNIEVINFFKKLLGLGKTIIVTLNPKMIDESFINVIGSLADLYFHVELRERYGVLVNFIDIVRFKRAAQKFEKQIPFRVDPGVGMSIEITG